MEKSFHDKSPKISLTVLGTLCFVTLVMCQTRFKITKELTQELYPPVLRSKDCWFLYTIENPDRFKCVLKAFVVITSPVISLISTAVLLFGKNESNPYFFLPWLFLTVKGLLLIQTDNIITILKDMGNKANYNSGFRLEDAKWILFYLTIFVIYMVEAFSFSEILDLFLHLWNQHPGYNVESVTLKVVKKEIADIMESLSKCSIGSLSKNSEASVCESDDACSDLKSRFRLLHKENENVSEQSEILLKCHSLMKSGNEDVKKNNLNSSAKSLSDTTHSDNENSAKSVSVESYKRLKSSKLGIRKQHLKADLKKSREKHQMPLNVTQ